MSSPTTSLPMLRNEKDLHSYDSGQTIFGEGDPGEFMYAVTDGEVDIVRQGRLIETLQAGAIFGEMALVDKSPRSAAAVACTDCTVARISPQRFMQLTQLTPHFALQVMAIMAGRLRRQMAAGDQSADLDSHGG